MILSRLSVIFFVVVLRLKEGFCGPDGDDEDNVKVRLLNLLSTSDLPKVTEDPSVDWSNDNHIIPPSYKNKDKFDYSLGYPYDYNKPQDVESSRGSYGRSRKFVIPWVNFGNNDDYDAQSKNSGSVVESENIYKNEKENDRYEVKEEPEDDYNNNFPPHNHQYHHQHQEYQGPYPTYYNPGFIKHTQGSYQGHSLHYHHNDDFHQQGRANPSGCFPFGIPRRRPRPRPPLPPTVAPTPTSSAPPSIDPRGSTLAGIVTRTEAPGIDIRVGRHTRDREERIVFPDE